MNAASERKLTPCYILHRRPFRETSVIVDVLADGFGLLGVVIKGVQAGGSGKKNAKANIYSALAQPFRPLLIDISGSGEMKNAYRIEANGSVISLQDKFLYSGFYVNELICRLWPKNIETDELYFIYREVLNALLQCQSASQPDNIELERVLRQFEFTLLNLLGFAVDFDYTADNSDAIIPGKHYQFNPSMGFTQVDSEVQYRQQMTLYDGADILAIGILDFSNAKTLKAAKQLARTALSVHLGSKPLKSRELFLSLR